MTAVLLAEHDPAVAEMLTRYLTRDGLAVNAASTPQQTLAALAAALDTTTCAAVLDLTMPGLDPRRLRQALRGRPALPVVFLVAPGPRPRGLAGPAARRWLTRPFGPRLLTDTVHELLRNAAGTGTGGSVLVHVDGRPVRLTATEYAFLAVLLDSPGRPRTRGQLLAAAGSEAGERAADVHIAQLRAKVGASGLIRTVRGVGFMVERGDRVTAGPQPGGTANPRGQ